MRSHLCQKVIYLFLQAMPSLKNNFRSHPIWSTLHRLGTIYSSLYSYTTSLAMHIKITKKITYLRWVWRQWHTSSTTFLDAPKSASLMHPLLSTRMFAPYINHAHYDKRKREATKRYGPVKRKCEVP